MHGSTVHFADRACHETAAVVENVQLARDTLRLRIAAPRIAERIVPGQFVMVRLAGFDDPLLGRPLAIYDTFPAPAGPANAAPAPLGLDVVYLVQGKLTTRLAKFQPGQLVQVWGPLGNGFSPPAADHLVMVAGGIGQTPFPALAQETLGTRHYGRPLAAPRPRRRVTLCYGARSADYLAGLDDFRGWGVEVVVSTDDGSLGHHGLVTEVLEKVLADSPQAEIAACGPEPMLAAVARLAAARGVRCQVSLETPMACGIGICFSCVTRVKDAAGGWDYRRTCVEGPVFEGGELAW